MALNRRRKQQRFSGEVITKVIEGWVAVTDAIEDEHNKAAIKQFMEDFQERLFTQPASPSVDYQASHNCLPGGLAEHSLRVYKFFRKMVHEHMDDFDHPVTEDDIIIAALFHDMGKIGDVEDSYYLDQDSDWHADRGMFYKLNPDIEYMKVQHRSLYLLQYYGVELNKHVFKAVLLHDGPHDQYNTQYSMKEGLFAILLSHADVLAALKEQKRYLDWEKKHQ